VHLNPYGEYAVTLAADLANHPPDSTGELVDRCVDAGIVVDFPVTDDDLADVLAMLDRWSSIAGVLEALFSVGTALHLVGRGMHRLGRCALDECTAIYADTSRNGRQRYCSPKCANRDAVRRHRAR